MKRILINRGKRLVDFLVHMIVERALVEQLVSLGLIVWCLYWSTFFLTMAAWRQS